MRVAIYSRKSKFTGKGDSIENQVILCKQEAIRRFGEGECEFVVFEDEGFSGKNTQRPAFQKMCVAIRKKQFDVLICYRLDRVSRSVSDFSQFTDELGRLGTDFISLRENFDTSNSMGRAMMNIASVFAQLERETIAERIRDNMEQLAKTGRWLGGSTPVGYESVEICAENRGKKSTQKMLKIVPEEAELVKLIFEKYIETGSLAKVETYCMQKGISNPRTNVQYIRTGSIRKIIINPVYCQATPEVREYLINTGCEVCDESDAYNGICALMAYGKTDKTPNMSKTNDQSEWIVAVGKHEGIISGEQWLRAQEIIDFNKDKTLRKPRNHSMLLSGLLYCSQCGSVMRPRTHCHSGKAYNTYYLCEVKDSSRKTLCQKKNVPSYIDKLVVDAICTMYSDTESACIDIEKRQIQLQEFYKKNSQERQEVKEKIAQLEHEIQNLLQIACQYDNLKDAQILLDTISTKNEQLACAQKRATALEMQISQSDLESASLELFKQSILTASQSLKTANLEQQRRILRSILSHIDCYDSYITIYFKFDDTGTEVALNGAPIVHKSSASQQERMHLPLG